MTSILRGILQGHPNVVEFGYARLQIGDPATFPSSPWRSPDDPSDVDGDGEVTENDLYLLEIILGMREPEVPYQSPEPREGVDLPPDPLTDEIRALMELGAQGSIQLTGSEVPLGQAPYLDVNGDRVADIKDVRAVQEEFQMLPPSDNNPTPLAYIMEDGFELGVQWVNLRTQTALTSSSQVRVGDLIQIEWQIPFAYSWLADPHFKFVEGRDDLVQIVKPGNVTFHLKPVLDPMGYTALAAGVTQEVLLARLSELATPVTRRVTAQTNNNRPMAADRSYPYTQFLGLDSAREAVEFLSQPNALDLRIEANDGLLKGSKPNSSFQVMQITNTNRGTLSLNEDGSFLYSVYDLPYNHSLYESLKEGDAFSYVIVSPEGISEIHTASIEPVTLPLLDLHLRAVDENGAPIQSAVVGDEFYIEVMTFGNDNYRRKPRQFRPAHSLQLDYRFNTQIAQPIGSPETSEIFIWERPYLVTENGLLVIKTETMRPEFVTTDGEIRANFDRFSLNLPEFKLFRQKVVATQPGSLQLELNDPVLVGSIHDMKSIRVQTDNLMVLSAVASSTAFTDVSGDGIVSPLDSLLVINRLNAAPHSTEATKSASATDPHDVNRDGIVSPLDALIIINWLNLHAASVASGEGESAASAGTFEAMAWDTEPFDDAFHKRRSRFR